MVMKQPCLKDHRRSETHRGHAQCAKVVAKQPSTDPKPDEEIPHECLSKKSNGVDKNKTNTLLRKRGEFRRKMQFQERLFLEAIVQKRIRDIRYSMEALQATPTTSHDVTVDGISSHLAQMSIHASTIDQLHDYEHYWPEQLNPIPVTYTRHCVNNGIIQSHGYVREPGHEQSGYAIGHDGNGHKGNGYYIGYAGYDNTGNRNSNGYASYDYTAHTNETSNPIGIANGNGYANSTHDYGYGHAHGYAENEYGYANYYYGYSHS